MNNKTTIKIFIASSAELKEEREKCISNIFKLNKSYKNLFLEPVEWEYDMVHASFPGQKNIQSAINPKLEECQLAVFLFYSRIGKYTKEEFEYATRQNKRLFAYFKKGFSPDSDSYKSFGELLDFKKSLNDTVLYVDYADLVDFNGLLYENLNLYLSENYPIQDTAGDTPTVLPQTEGQDLKKQLAEKDDQIKKLIDALAILPGADKNQQVAQLLSEKEEIKNKLLQTEDIIKQQAKDKAELQKQLATKKQKDDLKEKALEAFQQGDYPQAELHLKESVSISLAEAAATFYEMAKIKKIELQYADAAEYYNMALSLSPGNSLYLNEAGLIAADQGQFDKAIQYFGQSLETELAAKGDQDPGVATRYNNLGLAWYRKGNYDTAINYYEKALPIDMAFYGGETPEIALIYNNFGLAYYDKGQYDKAIAYYQSAVAIYEKKDKEHPQMAILYNNLGLCYCDYNGQYDTAIDYFNKAFPLYKKLYGEDHPQTALLFNNFGLAYNGLRQYAKAIEYYEKALKTNLKVYGEQHPMVSLIYNNLGEAYRQELDNAKAIEYFEKAIPIDIKFYGDEHPQVATRYNNLALALYGEQLYAQAITDYEKSLTIFKKFLPPEHPSIKRVAENLSFAKAALESQQKGLQ